MCIQSPRNLLIPETQNLNLQNEEHSCALQLQRSLHLFKKQKQKLSNEVLKELMEDICNFLCITLK